MILPLIRRIKKGLTKSLIPTPGGDSDFANLELEDGANRLLETGGYRLLEQGT